jgi:hypothetical protein
MLTCNGISRGEHRIEESNIGPGPAVARAQPQAPQQKRNRQDSARDDQHKREDETQHQHLYGTQGM